MTVFLFILAVVTSAMVSIFMRASKKHVNNQTTMLAFNYAMCTVLALLGTQNTQLVPAHSGTPLTLGLGLINGFFYLGGFVMLQWNIGKNGVALSATFMKLGVMVPTLMAVFLFGETPGALQMIGIVMALAAIVLIQFEKGQSRATSGLGLLTLLFFGGMADGMSKVYEVLGDGELKNHFLLYTFFMALVLCTALALCKKQSITLPDVLCGLLIGIPNYFTSRFLLLSLDTIPAVVAYPCYSVGTIVLVTLAGALFFREKLSRKQLTALAIILAALVLLNL